MFSKGNRIRLKQEVIDKYVKDGTRPAYFNDGGYMDYMFDGRVMTIINTAPRSFRVFVDREEWYPYPDDNWMLMEFDVELAVVDNRQVA